MIKNIINTFFFRSFNAILSFIIVIITARYLGAEIRGEISLFVLNVTLIFQLVSLVSGGGLVYYATKRRITSVIAASFIWSFLATSIGIALLYFTGFVQKEMLIYLVIATLLLSWFYTGMNVILGFEKIKTFNFLSSFQMVLMTGILLYFVFYRSDFRFDSWLYAYLISFAVGIVAVKLIIIKIWSRNKHFVFHIKDFVDLFHYGKWAQLANIAQLLNYRLGYYLLEYFAGKAALGVYSSAVAIAEAVWLISKSFAMVVFTRISNTKSQRESLELAFQYARISLYFSAVLMLFLLLIPSSVYIAVFGSEFEAIKPILILLSPGVLVFSLTTVYAHYFSGTERPRISSTSSIVGLVVTLLAGLVLVPLFEKTGVAITASFSFISSGIYLIAKMLKEPNAKLKYLLPSKTDKEKIKAFLKISS
jgi:O-antigen/teichoic acid export membrane protein